MIISQANPQASWGFSHKDTLKINHNDGQGILHRQTKALTLNRSSSMTLHNQQSESGGPGKGQDILPLLSGRSVQMCQCLVKVWKCLVHMFCGEMQLNHRPFQHTKNLTGHLCS